MTTDASTVAWDTPRAEEPGGLQSMGPQNVEHSSATEQTRCLCLSVCLSSLRLCLRNTINHTHRKLPKRKFLHLRKTLNPLNTSSSASIHPPSPFPEGE